MHDVRPDTTRTPKGVSHSPRESVGTNRMKHYFPQKLQLIAYGKRTDSMQPEKSCISRKKKCCTHSCCFGRPNGPTKRAQNHLSFDTFPQQMRGNMMCGACLLSCTAAVQQRRLRRRAALGTCCIAACDTQILHTSGASNNVGSLRLKRNQRQRLWR